MPENKIDRETGLSYAEQPPQTNGRLCFPDLVGVNMLRTALNLQVVFVRALESLDNDFFKVIMDSPSGIQWEKEITAAFDGLVNWVSFARRFESVIRENLKRNHFVMLASLLSDEKWYLINLAPFIGMLSDSYLKLRAIRGSDAEFNAVLSQCACSRNPNYSLDEVMLTCVSYPQHLLQLCKTELTYRSAFERAHASMLSTSQFCEPMFPEVAVVPKFIDYEIPGNETLNPLGDIVLKADELSSWIRSSVVTRQIRIPPGREVPDPLVNGQARKLIDIVPGHLRHAQSFGLTYNVSASLILFSDGAVLCRNDATDKYHKYVFVDYYWKNTFWYQINSEQRTCAESTINICLLRRHPTTMGLSSCLILLGL